WTR
ncbi:hypothetical protein D030_1372B, partial [Vibrio parahaemolyticus AQ3810]